MGTGMLCRLSYPVVSRFLAVLLLLAAVLKLNGLAVDPAGRMGWFTATSFQIAIIEFELFLTVWLLWGKRPIGSWMTTLVVFLIFACVSAYQGWIGRASCGCFGKLSVSPWYAFAIDLGVLVALVVGRPVLSSVLRQPRLLLMSVFPALCGLGGAAVLLALLASLATLFHVSPDAVLAHLRGERISLYPRLVDVGTGAPGEEHEAVVEVVNRTDHPIRLIGGTKD